MGKNVKIGYFQNSPDPDEVPVRSVRSKSHPDDEGEFCLSLFPPRSVMKLAYKRKS